MLSTARVKQSHHPQLWHDIWQAQDPWLYREQPICESTRYTWVSRPPPPLVGAELFEASSAELRRECDRLRKRITLLSTIVRLLVVTLRVFGPVIRQRVPEATGKLRLLHAIERSADVLPLAAALAITGLSQSRYHQWKAAVAPCMLDDRPSCPRRSPSRITFAEISRMSVAVVDVALRHMSIRALALHMQRIAEVCAAPSTWYAAIKRHGWRRQSTSVYETPTQALRADRPNQIWHIDTTLLRLIGGSIVRIQAVIDNHSRMILAWAVTEGYGGDSTLELLQRAAALLRFSEPPPDLLADAGSENINTVVDDYVTHAAGLPPRLRRLIARIDVRCSNSMVERFWLMVKHRCLYLERLVSIEQVRELFGTFVDQYNRVIPHHAFRGQTPMEMYLGTGDHWPALLAERLAQARRARIEHNRSATCEVCPAANSGSGVALSTPENLPSFQRARICVTKTPEGA